jgi:hypothetical protein
MSAMHSCTLQQVAIWLEDAATNEAAFAHAVEWAARLNLPLRVFAVIEPRHFSVSSPRLIDRLKSWAKECDRRGVALESHLFIEPTQEAVEQYLRENSLCVFSERSESTLEEDLLRRSLHLPLVCQLFGAATFAPITRLLILCRDEELRVQFLESAARLCYALGITPLILILARSECDAELKHEYVQGVFHAQRMFADVDFVIDRDPGLAVRRMISWRGCSHLVVPSVPDVADWVVRDLAYSVSVLTLPSGGSLDMPCGMRSGGVFRRRRLNEFKGVTATEQV